MDEIRIQNVNAAYVRVTCEPGIARELYDYFTFKIPNAHFNPKVKARLWDGNIRLFSLKTRQIYAGLCPEIERMANLRGYSVVYEQEPYNVEFSLEEAREFITKLKPKYDPRYYQIDTLINAIRYKNLIILSPTSSGKSLSIYLITRYLKRKTLIIVPTIQLVEQMYSDFVDYSSINNWNVEKYCHRIYGGKDKDTEKPIVISTWQSIYNLPESYFQQFDVVIGDEVHGFKANCLKSIMEKATNAYYRIGMTGTLDGALTNELVLRGLFGRIITAITTPEMQEQGFAAKSLIKCLILKHDDAICKLANNKDFSYQNEIDYLVASKKRNLFITNLALSLESNTMILFNYIEKHGHILNEMLERKLEGTDRKLFYVWGATDVDDREAVRRIVETEKNAIILASTKVFSTGVNIKNLHNVIFTMPTKSQVRVLQSIGRSLRLHDEKNRAIIFDIADDLRYNKTKSNTTLKHFVERIGIYSREGLDYKVYKIQLKG